MARRSYIHPALAGMHESGRLEAAFAFAREHAPRGRDRLSPQEVAAAAALFPDSLPAELRGLLPPELAAGD